MRIHKLRMSNVPLVRFRIQSHSVLCLVAQCTEHPYRHIRGANGNSYKESELCNLKVLYNEINAEICKGRIRKFLFQS